MTRPWWPLNKRFLAKVDTKRTESGCLVWIGNKNKKGYGLVLLDGAGTPQILATHAALLLREIKEVRDFYLYGWGVFHTCDNSSCVYTGDGEDDGTYIVDGKAYERFGHLWIGPRHANNKDMWNKGRSNWQTQGMPNSNGVDNVNAKVTEELVRRIRLEHKYGGGSLTYIAKIHNLSTSTVQRIIARETWKHVA